MLQSKNWAAVHDRSPIFNSHEGSIQLQVGVLCRVHSQSEGMMTQLRKMVFLSDPTKFFAMLKCANVSPRVPEDKGSRRPQ